MSEFNLSEKEMRLANVKQGIIHKGTIEESYLKKDVKEFIKLLKEEVTNRINQINKEIISHRRKDSGSYQNHRIMVRTELKKLIPIINQLAGEKLI